jgi:hypothetical protein
MGEAGMGMMINPGIMMGNGMMMGHSGMMENHLTISTSSLCPYISNTSFPSLVWICKFLHATIRMGKTAAYEYQDYQVTASSFVIFA